MKILLVEQFTQIDMYAPLVSTNNEPQYKQKMGGAISGRQANHSLRNAMHGAETFKMVSVLFAISMEAIDTFN